MAFKHQMIRNSMVVGFFSLLGGLTGILVDTSIAANLGLSRSSDTFYVAFTVPYIIMNLLYATGQFSLVPFFAALQAGHAPQELWRGFSYAMTLVLLGLGSVALVGVVGAPVLVRAIAPGLATTQTIYAAQLARWLFLVIVPAGLAEVIRSFLLSQRRFAVSSAVGFFRNSVVVLCILFLFKRYGEYSIVLGYVAGYLIQLSALGIQLVAAFPVRLSLTLAGGGEAFRNLHGAGKAQLGGALAWQGVTVVERIIASFLPPGSLTALNWGFKIMSTLAELLVGSVGTVALPALSRAVAHQAREEERRTFRNTLEICLTLLAPAGVFCLLLNQNIIRLVFERGHFTAEATDLMARVFFYYSLSLLLFSFVRVLTFYLFARNEGATFLRLTLALYGLNVLFDLVYVGLLHWGAIGIPLGLLTALALTCWAAFHLDLAGLKEALDRTFRIFALKNLVGALLAVVSVEALRLWLKAPTTGFENFIHLCGLCGTGSLVFLATLAALRALRISQFTAIWSRADEP
jgi:putative peptidoglycan lipid II flippase